VILALAATTASARPRRAGQLPARCLGTIERLKTLSDPDRRLVRLRPRSTTIGAIAQLPAPHPTPTRRRTAFQKQAWVVIGQIVVFRSLPDGSIELALFDDHGYIRVGMPSPDCLTNATRGRRTIVAARKSLVSQCGQPRPNSPALGAVAYVTGVGFWNPDRPKLQAAANGAELQPVTNLRLIAGCR
jgi:hypothetical protein